MACSAVPARAGPAPARPLVQVPAARPDHRAVGRQAAQPDDGHGDPEALRKIIRGDLRGTGCGYHFGLADLACRAQEMGGIIRVGPSDPGGMAVEVLVPIPGGADD